MNTPQGFHRVPNPENSDGGTLSHLSYSRMSRYLLCPEQYRLYYVEGLRPDRTAASLTFGQAVHRSLSAFFKAGDNPIAVFKNEWEEARELPLRYSARESWESLNERGQRLLSKFLFDEVPKLSSVEVSEEPFKLAISNLESPFVGIIDLVARLDGVSTVIDFKTASASYQEYEVEMSDQLSGYQLARPEAKQLALCVFVKTKEPRIEWYVARRDGSQLREFLAKAEIVGQQISAGLFYKRQGKWCAWCDYLPLCMKAQAHTQELKASA